jgi:sporulation protein YlmC with PRC-barrel domain
MRSTMLSGTAVIALTALLSLAPGLAGAQTQTNTDTQTNVETTTEGTDTQTEVTTETETEVDDEAVTTEAEMDAEKGVDAAELIGDSVENADGEVLGDIETLVVTKEGAIKHVVIGVGGFLGIGEKEVAVPWDQIEVVPEEDRIIANISREELEASPEFEWPLITARDDAMTTPTGEQTTMIVDADGDGVDDALEAEQAVDQAADEAEQAADEAAEEAEQAADEAEETMDEAADDTAQAVDDAGQTLQPQAQFLAGSLIGARILSHEDEEVGEVDDVVMAADGSVQGVITEVGGFLGIDEKQVMISWSDLEVRRDDGGEILIRTGLDAQALEGLENYDYEAAQAGEVAPTTNN